MNHNTEARLSQLAMRMLDGIGEDTVDFVDNYSGDDEEPLVLPSRFPNLLVNGSQAIAVGMATNIPPHNLGEVIDATVHLIDNPEATPDDLMQFMQGPDFPTGALIMGRQGILDAYRTGKGSIRLRAVCEIEEGSGRGGDQIVVTEMPYQTSISVCAARIADLVQTRQVEGIADVNDESARGKTRLVIKLKKDAPALVILNNLYKHTPLQTNFAVNTVALVDGIPRTLNLVQALQAYVDHQVDVIRRRSEFRLQEGAGPRPHRRGPAQGRRRHRRGDRPDPRLGRPRRRPRRAHGRAVRVLRRAGRAHPRPAPRAAHPARQDRPRDRDGHAARDDRRCSSRSSATRTVLRTVIKNELAEVREKHADERRSKITFDVGDMNIEDLIDDEELVVTLSAKGYIKTVSADSFRSQGRGGRGVAGAKLRDEDYVSHILTTTAHAYLLFFSNLGRVYRLKAHEIPKKERTARGTAMPNLLQLQPGEHIQTIIDTRDYETNRFLFFATKNGQVKKTKFNEYDSSLRTGIIAINLRDGDELVKVIPTNGGDDILMLSKLGQAIRFSEDDVRSMGRAAAGVRGMKMRAGDEVVSLDTCRDDVAMLIVTDAGYGKRTQLEHFNRQGRGGQGVRGIKLTAKKGHVVAAFMVGLDDEIFVINSRRHAHPHAGARDLLAGPRRHRRAGHEPRRRRDGRLGGAGPFGRRRHRLALAPPSPDRCSGAPRARTRGGRRGTTRRSQVRATTARRCRWCWRWSRWRWWCSSRSCRWRGRRRSGPPPAPRPTPPRWPERRRGRTPRARWPPPTAPRWWRGGPRAATSGWWSPWATPAPRPRRTATA